MKNSKIVPIGNVFGIQYDYYSNVSNTWKPTIFIDYNGDKLLFPTYKYANEWLITRNEIDKII